MMTPQEQEKLVLALMATAEVMGNEIKPNVALVIVDDLSAYALDDVLQALTRVRRECSGKLTLKMILDILASFGARMAFIPAYDRLIDQAKRESRTPSYEVSAGWDANMREVAMRQSVTAGLLPMPNDDTKALPAPDKPKMYDEHVTYYRRREAGLRFKQLAEQIRSNGDKQFHYRAEHQAQITAEHEKRKVEMIKQLQGEGNAS